MRIVVDVVVIAALIKTTEGCDHAPSGLPIPPHPGAERYYREIGVPK